MPKFYLDDEKRAFYSKAYSHIQNCEDDFWRIDVRLKSKLYHINNSQNIRTLYSKIGKNGQGNHSYLTITFTCEAEKIIYEKLIPIFKEKYKTAFCYISEEPKVQSKDNTNPCLKYISHPNYWNVKRVKFEFYGGSFDDHNSFWESISEFLIGL